MKKKILILAGGISKERLISLDTGLQVAKELKKNGNKYLAWAFIEAANFAIRYNKNAEKFYQRKILFFF